MKQFDEIIGAVLIHNNLGLSGSETLRQNRLDRCRVLALTRSKLCAETKGQRKVFVANQLLECLPRSTCLPNERLRWNTNEVS